MNKFCFPCKHLQMKYLNHIKVGKICPEATCKYYDVTIQVIRGTDDVMKIGLKESEIERLDCCIKNLTKENK